VRAELEEEAEHLAEVGGVAVGVEQREPRRGVAPEGGDDARAGPGGQRAHLDARVRRHPRHPQQRAGASTVLVRGLDAVRRRLRREEGQPRRHRRRDVAHSTLPPAAPAAWASSYDGGAGLAGCCCNCNCLFRALVVWAGGRRPEVELAGRDVRWVVGCCSRGAAGLRPCFSLRPYEEQRKRVDRWSLSFSFFFSFLFSFSFLSFSLILYLFLFLYKTKRVNSLFCVYSLRAKLNTFLPFLILPLLSTSSSSFLFTFF
jgi:hypothetical protein